MTRSPHRRGGFTPPRPSTEPVRMTVAGAAVVLAVPEGATPGRSVLDAIARAVHADAPRGRVRQGGAVFEWRRA